MPNDSETFDPHLKKTLFWVLLLLFIIDCAVTVNKEQNNKCNETFDFKSEYEDEKRFLFWLNFDAMLPFYL